MDTRDFLTALWPADGIYCLATPTRRDDGRDSWTNETFNSINEAMAWIENRQGKDNIFFGMHTLAEHRVFNLAKRNKFTGEPGVWQTRTQANARACKCFFFDLDVGASTPATPKSATRQEALDALERFIFGTDLPEPLVTSSGGGFHVYWRLSEPLESHAWRGHAAALHLISKRFGLNVDPSRTTDQASVLRVAGTTNLKPGREPRPCAVIEAGEVTPTADFLARLTELRGDAPLPEPRLKRQPPAGGNLHAPFNSYSLDEVAEACEHVRNYREHGYGEGGYPVFYALGCGVIPYLEDGDEHFHRLARKHPRYVDSYGDEMRDEWAAATDGPSSCANLNAKCGGDACARCPLAKLATNPIQATRAFRKSKALPLPPPAEPAPAIAAVAPPPEPAPICDPPFPYKRTAEGIVHTIPVKGADGKPTDETEDVVICPYDMFPFEDCERTELEPSFTMWAAKIPLKDKPVVMRLAAAVINDTRTLQSALANDGVKLTPGEVGKMSHLMVHWGREVQKQRAASRQFDHLGWADEAKTQFVLPGTLYGMDGVKSPCTLSSIARQALSYVKASGSRDRSVELMAFYDEPHYVKHQFIIMCGLGAILFHALDQPGVVVNATGESGGSKSTAVYAAASFWGRPKGYVINATDHGMTKLARQGRAHTLCNLPVCMDEITELGPHDAKTFVFGTTQETDRIRLNPDGTEKAARGGIKSTITLSSANSSLNDLIGIENRAGVAGNMRVFEIFFRKLNTNAAAADAFLHEINLHYGWIGPEFLWRYLAQRVEIDQAVRAMKVQLDQRFGMVAPERFWGCGMAAALVAGHLAKSWGLLPFAIEPVRDWLGGEQLPYMRGLVKAEDTSQAASTLLIDFLGDKTAQTIRIEASGERTYAEQPPHGALVAHKDAAKQIVIVRKNAFRDWCAQRSNNGLRTIADLEAAKIIFRVDQKFAIGEGTTFATGRVPCFWVDLTHPDIAAAGATPKVVPLHGSPRKKEGVR